MASRRQRSYSKEVKEKARELRRAGYTYREIIKALGGDVPKNTLSGWIKDIELTPDQKERIRQIELEGSKRGREKAAEWNREQKRKRIKVAEEKARPVAERLANDDDALTLMASALYMGEGAKNEKAFCFGNSDPDLIRAWLAILRRSFDIDESKFACQLCISDNQDEEKLKGFWSEVTGIPLGQFMRSSIKKATGKTKEGYKGVCAVHYYSLEIKRYLDALGKQVVDILLGRQV